MRPHALCPVYHYVGVCGVRAIGPADWNKGTERHGNKVLPQSAVSHQGHKDSLQPGTEELYQHRLQLGGSQFAQVRIHPQHVFVWRC